MDINSKIIFLSDKKRISDLEQMNQTQFVLIQQLLQELEVAKQKLNHVEQLLQSVASVDILPK